MYADGPSVGDSFTVELSSTTPDRDYPNIRLESLNTTNTLEYLAPLIVILLATLLAIIFVFSCILCTCFSRVPKTTVKVRIDNSNIGQQYKEGVTLYKYRECGSQALSNGDSTALPCGADHHGDWENGLDPEVGHIVDDFSQTYILWATPEGYMISETEMILDRVTVL